MVFTVHGIVLPSWMSDRIPEIQQKKHYIVTQILVKERFKKVVVVQYIQHKK